MRYLDEYLGLKALYEAKQKLVRYTLHKLLTAERMKNKLPGFLELIKQLRQSPQRVLIESLIKHYQDNS